MTAPFSREYSLNVDKRTHGDRRVALRGGNIRLNGEATEGKHTRTHDAGATHQEWSSTDKVLREKADRSKDGQHAADCEQSEQLCPNKLPRCNSARTDGQYKVRLFDPDLLEEYDEVLGQETQALTLLQALDAHNDKSPLEIGTLEAVEPRRLSVRRRLILMRLCQRHQVLVWRVTSRFAPA
jgi:hypothetical protein